MKEFYGENAITNSSIIENFEETSVISPISYMGAGMISNKVIQQITNLNNEYEAVQIDVLDWTVTKYDLSK